MVQVRHHADSIQSNTIPKYTGTIHDAVLSFFWNDLLESRVHVTELCPSSSMKR